MILEVGKWYKTKREQLCRVDTIKQDGYAIVQSHFSGNFTIVPPDQITFFKEAETPDTAPGTVIAPKTEITKVETEKHESLYDRYPNIVAGSIYKVQATTRPPQAAPELIVRDDGKTRIKKKKLEIKGATRCLVKCQNCDNTKDIKVQDAFHVKLCDECKKKNKKKQLNKFLDKQKTKKAKSNEE